jgi:hypothetical protein
MLNFNINLTSLAIILWSGMLIIAGSIWVLSSQVCKLAEILADRRSSPAAAEGPVYEVSVVTPARPARLPRRGAPVRMRGATRVAITSTRAQTQLTTSRRAAAVDDRSPASELRSHSVDS